VRTYEIRRSKQKIKLFRCQKVLSIILEQYCTMEQSTTTNRATCHGAYVLGKCGVEALR